MEHAGQVVVRRRIDDQLVDLAGYAQHVAVFPALQLVFHT